MQYPAEFVQRCKEAFPEWTQLHQALDNGSEIVGRYLDDSCTWSVSTATILAANSLKELQAKARAEQTRLELYKEWGRIYLYASASQS